MHRAPTASSLVLVVALVACGGGRDDAPGSDDAAGLDAAGAPSDAGETTPDAGADPWAWLEPYQREVVGRLAGARELTPGVTLAHRASVAERDAARGYLLAELGRLGIPAERHDYRANGANVIAYLAASPGAPAGAGLIVVGAHFDSVPAGPGAADNATGVAIVLAAARHLRELPGRRHPIAFALFDEEELGLIGSRAYAEQLVTTQVPVSAVHSFDMLSFDMDEDRAIELWSPAAALEQAYRARGVEAGVPIQPVSFTRSDHQAFLDRNLPAVGLGEEFVANDHTPHYHRATDTFDKVDFAYLAGATRFALDVIARGATTD